MGCFWGAERKFWETKGVLSTSVGYAGGITPNPTYREVCSGGTGHTEVVRVVFEPKVTSYDELLRVFWENHNPTQGMRQGNDVGTQYRSAIYTSSDAQKEAADRSVKLYGERLQKAGHGAITTEILAAPRITSPRSITSSTSRRIRPATAASAARASPARSVSVRTPPARESIRDVGRRHRGDVAFAAAMAACSSTGIIGPTGYEANATSIDVPRGGDVRAVDRSSSRKRCGVHEARRRRALCQPRLRLLGGRRALVVLPVLRVCPDGDDPRGPTAHAWNFLSVRRRAARIRRCGAPPPPRRAPVSPRHLRSFRTA